MASGWNSSLALLKAKLLPVRIVPFFFFFFFSFSRNFIPFVAEELGTTDT